ncbi:MAG: ImmA/IrrE family metallo-endopeptidase [Gemmatimonadota bacterium]
MSYDQIRQEASEFLAQYHEEGSIPTPIEEIVEFDFEMATIPIEGLSDHLGVDAFLSNDLTAVFVDQYVMEFVEVRYRFSLAHELGHHWLHDELYQSAKIASVRDFKEVQEAIGDNYRWFEFHANSFAGLVLVPPETLKARFTRRVEDAKAGGVPSASIPKHPVRQAFIEGLAREFNVSEQAMTIRLEKDGLLPPLV